MYGIYYKPLSYNSQGCHFTLKNLEFDNLGKKTWNFEQKSQKNLEKPGIFNNFYTSSSKISL